MLAMGLVDCELCDETPPTKSLHLRATAYFGCFAVLSSKSKGVL